MKVIEKILAVTGLVLLIIFLIAILSPEDDKQPLPTYNKGLEKNYLREGFMEGRLGEDANYAYCSCTYNYLDRELTDLEFVEMGESLEDGEMTDVMWDAWLHCIDYIE